MIPKRGGARLKLTEDQQNALITAYRSGADPKSLADRFHIDVTNVRRYARRAGIFRRQPTGPEPIDIDHEYARIERLTAYDKRSLTGRLFGDPPVGFSALDRR